jgi:hypothetical protein
MKKTKILFVFILAFMLSGIIQAQECSYFNLSEGMVLGYQNLDAKGKVTSTTRTTCLSITKAGASIIYKLKNDFVDAKNNNPSTRELEMRCEDGKFYMDMQNLIDPKSMEAFKGMEISVDATDMVYATGLVAGQSLPDANITVSAATGGIAMLNLSIDITNRKVVGTESVTVPAGTFDCFKITYDVETKMMFKVNATVTEYVNMGVGNVKTETYDKKGKLAGTTQLVEVKK